MKDEPTLHIWTVWHPEVSQETYKQHRDILLHPHNKQVYWGVIHDNDYSSKYGRVLEGYLEKLKGQIIDGIPTYLFINTLDSTNDFFWGEIEAILTPKEFIDWRINKSPNKIITYYAYRNNQLCGFLFVEVGKDYSDIIDFLYSEELSGNELM